MAQQYSHIRPARHPSTYTGLEIFNFITSTCFQINESYSTRLYTTQSLAYKCIRVYNPFTCTSVISGKQRIWHYAIAAGTREDKVLRFSGGKVTGFIQYGDTFQECLRFIRNYFAHANHMRLQQNLTDEEKGKIMYTHFRNAVDMCFDWYEDANEIRRLNHLRID